MLMAKAPTKMTTVLVAFTNRRYSGSRATRNTIECWYDGGSMEVIASVEPGLANSMSKYRHALVLMQYRRAFRINGAILTVNGIFSKWLLSINQSTFIYFKIKSFMKVADLPSYRLKKGTARFTVSTMSCPQNGIAMYPTTEIA